MAIPTTTKTTNRTSPIAATALWLAAMIPPLVIYWLTLAPGLVADGDSPKFQFLGAVLGTAHEPGYPLFIELSWLASKVSVGTLAWRVNVMTMLFGVLAAGLASWTAREAGATKASSLFAGLGLAFGPVFWAQATLAEVYTLATVFQLATIGWLLRWARTRRDRDLLIAVGIASLALGHHPTFVMMAPSFALFVFLTDWRAIIRPRMLLATIALAMLGLAQYLYVIIRTHQHAAYLEATALGWRDLIDVLRGEQYGNSLFAFSVGEIVNVRATLISHILGSETSALALGFAAVGALWLLTAAPRTALLMAGAAMTVFGFACTYQVGDIQVFCIPVIAILWIAAACGLGVLEQRAARFGWIGPVLSLVLIVAAAKIGVTRSFGSADRSHATSDADFLSALFAQIETPARIVLDYDHPGHQAIANAARYKVFVDHADARVLAYDEVPDPFAEPELRRATYAFAPAQRLLEARGLMFGAVHVRERDGRMRTANGMSVLRAVALAPCRNAGDRKWTSLAGTDLVGRRVSLWIRPLDRSGHAGPSRVLAYAASNDGVPRLALDSSPSMPVQESARFDRTLDVERAALTVRLMEDGLAEAPPGRFVSRYDFGLLNADGPDVGWLALGREATGVSVRITAPVPVETRLCSGPVDSHVIFGDASETDVDLLVGTAGSSGWHGLEETPNGPLRWSASARATINFTLAAPLPVRLLMTATPLIPRPDGRIAITINGRPLEERDLPAATTEFEWVIPPDYLRAGYNEIAIDGPLPQSPKALGETDDRLLSLGVRRLTLRRDQ